MPIERRTFKDQLEPRGVHSFFISCLFTIIVVIYITTVKADITNEQIDELRYKIQKRDNFFSIKDEIIRQKDKVLGDGLVRRLMETADCLQFAGDYLSETIIDREQYESLLQGKKKQLDAMRLAVIDADNMAGIIHNSAQYISNDVINFVRTRTKSFHGVEYYAESTNNVSLTYPMLFRTVEGAFPKYENQQLVRRIRNRISVGQSHALYLLPNGKLYSTGYNASSSLGRTLGMATGMLHYLYPVEGLENRTILQFHTVHHSSIVLTDDGVYSFGYNGEGQLGTGRKFDSSVATKVLGFAGATIAQVAAGYSTSYAIDTNGKVWIWGSNLYGALGDRTGGDKARPFPMYYNGTFYGKKALRVCGGETFSVVLSTDGDIFTFGSNVYGELGLSSTIVKTMEPLRMPLVGALFNDPVIDISCGFRHTLALLSSGQVVGWGSNNHYQLGDGTTTNVFQPKLIPIPCNVSMITAGYETSFAVCTNSTIFTWGYNSKGEAGVGNVNAITKPTLVTSFTTGKIMEVVSSQTQTYVLTSDDVLFGAGGGAQTTYFNTTITNKFSVMKNYLNHTIPWQLRKLPYFEAAGRVYALVAWSLPPSRPGNGFNMYYRNKNESEAAWNIIEYDPVNNRGFPASIYNSHFLKYDEYIYFFGGFVNDSLSDKIFRAAYADVETWEVLDQRLPYRVAGGMSFVVGNYFYIFGGITSMYNERTGDYHQNVTRTIIRAPVSNLTDWQEWDLRYLPTPLHSATIGVVGDYIYLFGGCPEVYSCTYNIYRALLSDVGTWMVTYGILPHYYANGVLVQTPEHIYLFGGFNDPNALVGVSISKARKTDPVGAWNALTDKLPYAMAYSGGFDNGTQLEFAGYDFRPSQTLNPSIKKFNQIILVDFINEQH
ncbi:hypothetical protein C9374_007982 [Naegleria lovaniensis]|uniref:RCC1-like domain-containing protein n=1 Tax=Naegleria lovaniensis TaxID=51637 RepID=A0AA88GG90_NAELO|nr:uncharacterized protein C9374_007982 [Naegleria lovaniensis]KAG2378834.1 hypothetical protein C9374_007982 [Naegleria lovaniensis]